MDLKWVDVFPIYKMGIFQPAMLVYQRILSNCNHPRFPFLGCNNCSFRVYPIPSLLFKSQPKTNTMCFFCFCVAYVPKKNKCHHVGPTKKNTQAIHILSDLTLRPHINHLRVETSKSPWGFLVIGITRCSHKNVSTKNIYNLKNLRRKSTKKNQQKNIHQIINL